MIKAADPAIVILNEIDQGTARAFGVLQADSLGRMLGMDAILGSSIGYEGGQYGNALLSKLPVLDFQVIDLATDSLLEGRSVFLASLLLNTDTLFVMGTHLGLNPKERIEQIDRILQVLPNSTNQILGGDFNFEPYSEPYFTISKSLNDELLEINSQPNNTFPADHPDRRIDYIFIGSNIDALGMPVLALDELSIASDHRPQVIKFQIKL